MTDSTKPSAAQQVLSTCELISEILQSLYEDHSTDENDRISEHSSPSWYSILQTCSRVNKSWFSEAMRLLWLDGTAVKHRSLIQIFAMIEPSRRQYYANYIESACFVDVCKANIRKNNKIMRGMVFPKLRYLAVIIQQSARQKLWMPYLNAPRLEALHVRLATIQWPGGYKHAKVMIKRKHWLGPSLQSSIAVRLIRRIQRVLKGVKLVLIGMEIMTKYKVILKFSQLVPNVRLAYVGDFDGIRTFEGFLKTCETYYEWQALRGIYET